MRGEPDESLAELLEALELLVLRYVVLPAHGAVAAVLWVAHAHAFDAWDATPYLSITSPEKRCGKTRLLEVLEVVVPKPWRVVRPSEAVLFRRIARDCPALLLDEADAIFRDRSENTEGLRALLNAGYRRGAVVPRCVGQSQALRDFSTYCPKVLAGIGALPDTVADRCVPLRLARRRSGESVARLRSRVLEDEAAPLREALAAWAIEAVGILRDMRPELLEELNDRAAEAWEPLLAIADVAGGMWPERARMAARALHESEPAPETTGVQLLRAIRAIFDEKGCERMLTSDLLAALIDRGDAEPWGMWWGADLDKGNLRGPGHKLAKYLRPFGIAAKPLRVGDQRGRGFERRDCADAFARYLDDVTTGQPLPDADFDPSVRRDTPSLVTSASAAESRALQSLSPRHVLGDARNERSSVVACKACGEARWRREGDGLACLLCGAVAGLDGKPTGARVGGAHA